MAGPLRILAASVVLGHSGCAGFPTDTEIWLDSQAEWSNEIDERAILSSIARFRSTPEFVRVNETPYPSALDPSVLINVYVSVDGYEGFERIAPEADGSGADVPEGALIVRETHRPDGAVASLTLMYKGPPGYNPDLNDFWFGVTDPLRAPVVEDGVPMTGQLEECYSCHLARPNDGYLFGVPAANRASF